MFFRRSAQPADETLLRTTIDEALPTADATTREIVVAIVGLFGCVSYADQDFSEREQQLVRNLLQSIDGISAHSADAILDSLRRNILQIATTEAPRFTRALMQHAATDLRLSVLDMLLDIAAVDHDISHDEVTVLRQLTKALGLQQDDYNALQVKHRAKLRALKLDWTEHGSVTADGERY